MVFLREKMCTIHLRNLNLENSLVIVYFSIRKPGLQGFWLPIASLAFQHFILEFDYLMRSIVPMNHPVTICTQNSKIIPGAQKKFLLLQIG